MKRFLVILFVALLAFGLVACERSLAPSTKKPATTATQSSASPVGTGDVMEQLELFVTQTAMAASGQKLGTPTAAGLPTEAGAATPEAMPTSVEQPTSAPVAAAPTATMVPVPPATPGIPQNYTLQKNEFPYCIARRFNVDPAELLSLNGLGPNSLLQAGMVLKIPQTGRTFPGTRALRSHPTNHTVAGGETIYSIACSYGDVDPNGIIIANGLTAPYSLTSGQNLYIP